MKRADASRARRAREASVVEETVDPALYVVSTPIGNLADITRRAVEVLGHVSVCYAEDTRRTGRLLAALGADVPLRSLHAHNEAARVEEVLARLREKQACALVSDAGTPVVSDPGRRLVDAVLEAGLPVVPVPGPSAVMAALAISGLPADRFLFLGFPPRGGEARRQWLERVARAESTVVVFESPRRLAALLRDLEGSGLGERDGVVCRELTKLHEEVRRGTVSELRRQYDAADVRGEVTVVLRGGEGEPGHGAADDPAAARTVARTLSASGLRTREIAAKLQERCGLARNEAYELALGAEEAGREPAARIRDLPPYPLADVPTIRARLRAEGRRVLDLGAGDAGLPVPGAAVEALRRAAGDPALQRYAFQRGLPRLREAIAGWMERRYGRRPDPSTEVLPLIGSKEGIAHLGLAFADPGDTVLVPAPGYAPYAGGARLSGARIARAPLLAEEGFLVPPDRIRRADERLRIVYLNYPNNPTGASPDRGYLQAVLEAARARGALLAWDAAYAEVAFDGYRSPGLLEVEGGLEGGIEFHSFSKGFNMTGWRLGWACASADTLAALSRVKTYVDTGPYLGIQAAGAAALEDAESFLAENVRRLRERRDAAVAALREVGLDAAPPRATFYLWIPVPTGEPSLEFARRALEQEALVLLPGRALGEAGEGYLRLALTRPPEEYEEVARRLARCL